MYQNFFRIQYFHDKAIAKEIDFCVVSCPHCSWTGEYRYYQVSHPGVSMPWVHIICLTILHDILETLEGGMSTNQGTVKSLWRRM